MCLLRLGNLATLLSESLVNGFTTGAAMHVLASQLKELFGVKIPQHKGLFQIIYVHTSRPSHNLHLLNYNSYFRL